MNNQEIQTLTQGIKISQFQKLHLITNIGHGCIFTTLNRFNLHYCNSLIDKNSEYVKVKHINKSCNASQ